MKSKKSAPVVMPKKKSNTITVEAKTIMPKYNSFACGYGKFVDKNKKRSYRKANDRKIIKEFL